MKVYRTLHWRDYEKCARAGMTVARAAEHLGVSESAVHRMVSRHGLQFAPAATGRPAAAEVAASELRVKSFSASPAAIAKWERTQCKSNR